MHYKQKPNYCRTNELPVSGTSVGLVTLLICSMSYSSGDNPPCAQKIFSSTIAAIGRQLKQSVNVLQSLAEYRLLPEGGGVGCVGRGVYGTERTRSRPVPIILLEENRKVLTGFFSTLLEFQPL